MRVGFAWAAAVFALATAACNSILGDFETVGADATTDGDSSDGGDAHAQASDASSDATLPDAPVLDASREGSGLQGDAYADIDASAGSDAACAPGLTRCSSGCIALDAATACGSCTNDCTSLLATGNVVVSTIGCSAGQCTHACSSGYADCNDSGPACGTNLQDAAGSCGGCGHDCRGGLCSAGTCGSYVIAGQPTTGTVAKLATDGTRVFWSDTGTVAIEQIAATGGAAIALAPASSTNGAVGSELALAGRTVAFAYLGISAPSVGLATVDVADSGTSVIPGALAVNAVALNAEATHVFFVDVSGTQGSLEDCPIAGNDAGACLGVVGGGRFLGQTAADGAYLFFDLTGANVQQAGLYLDTVSTNTASIFTVDVAQSLAVDGTWAYWTIQNDAGTSYTIRRALEAAPTTAVQTITSDLGSSAFTTDGVNVYYWTGSLVVSRPVAGGAESTLATASSVIQIAVGGGLLVWTDGTTIRGLALAGH